MRSSTDRIEKRVLLKAPPARVWRAISDAKEFGDWFMEVDGRFAPGAHVTARIKPTTADPDVAKVQEKYTGFPIAFHIDRIEPMRLMSFRWHPFAIDKDVDDSNEPMTLVTFSLEPAERHGRERIWKLEPKRFEDVRRYLARISEKWDDALGRLKAAVER